MNTSTVEQMAKQYYWGTMLGTRTVAGAATTSSLRSWPPPAHGSRGEPSWEELAFARDAAGHLGGCVWPPRSYTCTFCRREFRSAQALGGHMNVHRRDRARLRQCASPSPEPDRDVVGREPISMAPGHQLLQLQESPLFRAKKAILIHVPAASNKSTREHQANSNQEEHEPVVAVTTSPTAIIREKGESKNIPAATAIAEKEVVAERRKRRRVDLDQPPPPQWPPASSKRVEHDAKLPHQVITSPSTLLNSLHLAGRQEVDLELRLGSIYS